MIKRLLYLALFLPSALWAQIAEVRTYGGDFFDEGRQIIETADGYIMVGTTSSVQNGNSAISVIRLNDDLTVNWSKEYGGIGADQGRSICARTTGGFFVLGQTNAGEIGEYDIVLYAIDELGNEEWVKYYGGTDWDLPAKIEAGLTSYFIGATTYNDDFGGTDQLLLEIDSDGIVMNTTAYDLLPNGEMADLKWYEGFLYTIGTRSNSGGTPQGVMRKIAEDGTVIWQDVKDSTSFTGLAITASIFGVTGAYGMTDVVQSNTIDLVVVHLDPVDGSELWSFWANTPDAGNQYARALIWGSDEVISVSETDTYGDGGLGALIVRSYFENGFYIGGSIFGGSQDEEPFSIIKDSAGRIVILGRTNSYGSGSDDFYLVRTPDEEIVNDYELDLFDFLEVIVTNIAEAEGDSSWAPYPNPASNIIHLPEAANVTTWTLYSPLGVLVSTGIGRTVQVDQLPSGTYLLKWGDEKGFTISKVCVQ